MQLPQRHSNHRLESKSELYFKSKLPSNWTANKPDLDYGVDLVVDIFDGDYTSGRELLVQLKASEESNAISNNEFERIRINISTYNMLWEKLQVVILVKYVASEDCAYWQLLSEVPEPSQDNSSMTIRIPKCNQFTVNNWDNIRDYIEQVHLRKLSSRERNRFSQMYDN